MSSAIILLDHGPLPGVDGDKGFLDGPITRSVTATLAHLRNYRIVSAAGDHGALSVWIDDNDQYRCGFYRWRMPVDEQIFCTKAEMKVWLTEWFPKLQEAA